LVRSKFLIIRRKANKAMADEVAYYAVVSGDGTSSDPSGLARRRRLPTGGFVDEALRRDLTWGHTSAIVEWKRDAMDFSLVEISEADAAQLIDRFRENWDAQRSSGN
jgi:hypothetical protein